MPDSKKNSKMRDIAAASSSSSGVRTCPPGKHRKRTYRETAELPARTAGRTARENIAKRLKGQKRPETDCDKERGGSRAVLQRPRCTVLTRTDGKCEVELLVAVCAKPE